MEGRLRRLGLGIGRGCGREAGEVGGRWIEVVIERVMRWSVSTLGSAVVVVGDACGMGCGVVEEGALWNLELAESSRDWSC